MSGPVLGVIADDFTGATDVASMLVRGGLRTVLYVGVPQGAVPDASAVVVALKSRTVPVDEAVAASLAAWRWLAAAGARQCYFKVCSTFDSTPRGNIGPVTEALMQATGAAVVPVCPAFPENGRTVFRGHLFVGDALLAESGMRHHPLTPMTDSHLVRVMQAQSQRRVGLLRHDTVARGPQAVRERLAALQAEGVPIVIADAVSDADLHALDAACIDLPLMTAGSGLAIGLPALYAERGWATLDPAAGRLDGLAGPGAVLSGSCSVATNAQVAHWRRQGRAAFTIDPRALARGEAVVGAALAAWRARPAGAPMLFHATVAPDALQAVQQELGVAHAGALVEAALAALARALVDGGVRRLVVAGGETSGAVVQALAVQALRIGAPICPGVPWTQAEGRPLWLALKSGNFGGPAFFDEALGLAAGAA